MEQMLQSLGGILLKAIPTAALLLVLYFYIKAMLFGPMQRVLKQRQELTAGARKAAEKSFEGAEAKAQEFEAKLRDARTQIYKEQEEIRKKWLEEQAAQIEQARAKNETAVKQAKQGIAGEAEAAKRTLADSAAALADQIASRVLAGRAG